MYWSELSSRGVLGLQGEILSLQLVVLKNVCHLPAHLRMSGGEKCNKSGTHEPSKDEAVSVSQ